MEHNGGTRAANPPRGGKAHFRKITVSLPPEAYATLIRESTRRKIAQEPNRQLSSLLREAVIEYLARMEWNQFDWQGEKT
jgi:transcriptional regulator of met regulon